MKKQFLKFVPWKIPMLPAKTEIGKYAVEKGDVLFVKLPEQTPLSEIAKVRDFLKKAFPDNKSICYEGGIEVSIVKQVNV